MYISYILTSVQKMKAKHCCNPSGNRTCKWKHTLSNTKKLATRVADEGVHVSKLKHLFIQESTHDLHDQEVEFGQDQNGTHDCSSRFEKIENCASFSDNFSCSERLSETRFMFSAPESITSESFSD